MAHPIPPQVMVALEQLRDAVRAVEQKDLDVLKAPWPELEKSVIKLLGGAFDMNRPEHQLVAVGLAGVLGERLASDHGAFWFLNRDSIEGASVGFPEALITLSPLGAVIDALSHSKLARLEELMGELRRSLAQVKFSPQAQGGTRLRPEDYQRLFDPGFIQFTVMDSAKAKNVWQMAPEKISREIREALGRATQLPPETKRDLEAQLLGAFARLAADKPLAQQPQSAGHLAELVGHLFATVRATGFAPEEFWEEAVMPLLLIGAPTQFPPLDKEELDAFAQGADPFALFLDVVPHQTPAPEEGVLGIFPVEHVQLPDPLFDQVPNLRLVELKRDALAPLLAKLDAEKTRKSVEAFGEYLAQKAGKPAGSSAEGKVMQDAAFQLLMDLKKALEAAPTGMLCMRRVTEAEAGSEAALSVVRAALNGPRIILA